MSDERVDIGKVLDGFGIHPMPEGWSPLEALVLIKAINDEGHSTWSYRTTTKMNMEEVLGMLSLQKERILGNLLAQWDE